MKRSWAIKENRVLLLFWTFCKISPITFGGGYAMIPVFSREVVERRKWLEEEEITDLFAISQSAPGAIAVNASIFVGYRVAGVAGALAALAGMLLPAFLVVLALSVSFLAVKDAPKLQAAFQGIRPAVVAMIAYAAIRVGRTSVRDWGTLLLAIGSLALLLGTGLNPLYALAAGLALGAPLAALHLRWSGEDVLADKGGGKRQTVQEDYFFGDGI